MGALLFRSGSRFADALIEAPNPKPTAVDKAGFGRLASLYTSFSKLFATSMLDLCISEGCQAIADPFSGMGTLGEAGRGRPVDLSLGDISPFAALSGAFRTSSRQEILEGAALVQAICGRIDARDEHDFFSQLLTAVGAGTETTARETIRAPSMPEHRAAALATYLAALSRLRLHKSLAGSNPTWMKRPSVASSRAATRLAVEQTVLAAETYAGGLEDLHPENRTLVRWVPFSEKVFAPASLDAIVTSPPYPNRTDYIRHYLPASELLLNAAGQDERSLRLEQIGTPLIRPRVSQAAVPAGVTHLVETIRSHPSYASERYYYKGFLLYFSDMSHALASMAGWLRPGGLMLLVAQDTYYKDVHVPVVNLLIELAGLHGLVLRGRRDWRVSATLSQLSPHSRRSVPTRSLSESLIAFSK